MDKISSIFSNNDTSGHMQKGDHLANSFHIIFLCKARRSCELPSIQFEKRIVCVMHTN